MKQHQKNPGFMCVRLSLFLFMVVFMVIIYVTHVCDVCKEKEHHFPNYGTGNASEEPRFNVTDADVRVAIRLIPSEKAHTASFAAEVIKPYRRTKKTRLQGQAETFSQPLAEEVTKAIVNETYAHNSGSHKRRSPYNTILKGDREHEMIVYSSSLKHGYRKRTDGKRKTRIRQQFSNKAATLTN